MAADESASHRDAATARCAAQIVHLVDDEDAVRTMLTRMIEAAGYTVRGYPSAETFLAAFDPRQPGCLVLDVRMTGMSGLELQRTLINRGIRIPVIILTGHGDVRLAVETMRLGAVDFVEKPVREHVLLAAIRDALAKDLQNRNAGANREEVLDRLTSLTELERSLLVPLILGRTDHQIAIANELTADTVATHRAAIFDKMHASTTEDLLRQVYTTGLIDHLPRPD